MNNLCLLSNLSSSEWAAWVQAIGSIAAVVGAAFIALWQSAQQHKSSLAILRVEQQSAKAELAKTLLSLSTSSAKVVEHAASQVSDRGAIDLVTEQQVHFDSGELQFVERAVLEIPLHGLPHTLVPLTMMLGSTLRQFREKVELVLRVNRQMDANAFTEFFKTIREMRQSLSKTCKDIEVEVVRIQAEA